MAIYHLTAKTGSVTRGDSAKSKADYIQRIGEYTRHYDQPIYIESGNMPEFAQNNPNIYWASVDKYERSNGRLYKEIEFALPIELKKDEQIKLAHEFAQHLTNKENLPYTLAIHAGSNKNPHCHLVINERINDRVNRTSEQWFKRYNPKDLTKGGAKKTESLKPEEWLLKTRQDWSRFANDSLKISGHNAQIDHRTLKEQGITDRIPQIHIGIKAAAMEVRGIVTDRGSTALIINEYNHDYLRQAENRERRKNQENREFDRVTRASSSIYDTSSRGFEESNRRDYAENKEPIVRITETAARDNFKSPKANSEYPTSDRELTKEQQTKPNLEPETMDNHFAKLSSNSLNSAEHIQFMAATLQAGQSKISSAIRQRETVGLFRETSSKPTDSQTKTDLEGTGISVADDRTIQAVTRQLQMMDCSNYDIGVRNSKTGKVLNRTWTSEEIIANTPWLKRMNAIGNDIYIRPAKDIEHGLVLLDDLNVNGLLKMDKNYHEPALILETSLNNYQAWLKIPLKLQIEGIKRGIAMVISEMYLADKSSATEAHFGRLAGFTNQTPKHMSDHGKQPYVLLRESTGKTPTNFQEIIDFANDYLAKEAIKKEYTKRIIEIEQPTFRFRGNAVSEYRNHMQIILKKYPDDLNKCDFIASINLAKKGFQSSEIKNALIEASPNLADSKTGHIEDYVNRTVDKVMNIPEVQESIKNIQQQKHRSQGFSL